MPISPESGLDLALTHASERRRSDAQVQALLEEMAQQKWLFQQQQQDRDRRLKAQSTAADLMEGMGAFKDEPPNTQPPPPGTPSQPMMQNFAPPAPPPGMPPGAMGGAPPPQPMMTQPPSPMGPKPPMAPDSWKPMPQTAPPPPGAGVSPTAQPESDSVLPRKLIDVTQIAKMLAAKGIKGQDAYDVLEAWKPFMDDENKTMLTLMQRENSAMRAAMNAYQAELRLGETTRHHEETESTDKERTDLMKQRVDLAKQRLKQNAAKAAGGEDNLKNTEYIYPKGEDGLPDESKPPIGARGMTKSGKIVVVDAQGQKTSAADLGGGTHKEGATVSGRSEKAKRDTALDQSRSTNELLREKALQLNGPVSGRPVDKDRVDAIDAELKRRNAIGGGKVAGAAGGPKPTPTQKDKDWVKGHPEDAAKYKAQFGVDPPT